MGKTIEYYTKALANGESNRKEAITLTKVLEEMATLVAHVGENAEIEQPELPNSNSQKVEQLTLFVMESKAKYEGKTQKQRKTRVDVAPTTTQT